MTVEGGDDAPRRDQQSTSGMVAWLAAASAGTPCNDRNYVAAGVLRRSSESNQWVCIPHFPSGASRTSSRGCSHSLVAGGAATTTTTMGHSGGGGVRDYIIAKCTCSHWFGLLWHWQPAVPRCRSTMYQDREDLSALEGCHHLYTHLKHTVGYATPTSNILWDTQQPLEINYPDTTFTQLITTLVPIKH
uniref:Uncharacterized protein n=1 Tax=Oryza sativa subsp. japonica TaxID=39947 RepID=Q69LV2_ORYSJ|nr:hypothetical protein [Oryza sativa Japonica Group]BAD36424.1 hypothetical protein [Oryza sativa Japonica Group]